MSNILAYFGGILDGEGCFGIFKRKSLGRDSFQPSIVVLSKDKELIHFLIDNFKAHFREHFSKGVQKTYYLWELLGCSLIRKFLKQIIPYLLIKRKQAELLLQFVESREKNRFYTKEEKKIYNELRRLKKEYPKKIPPYNFTKEEKLYSLAGLVDGEGSVRIAKSLYKNCYGNIKLILTPQISIGNTDKRMVRFLKKEFGGFYYGKEREANHKPIYQWFMQGNKEDFFRKLDNKLVIKKEQLHLILRYLESRKKNYTRENEIDFFLQMQKLNKKGLKKNHYTKEGLLKYTRLVRNPRKFFISKSELYNLYWTKNLSIRDISKRFNLVYNSVYERMKRYRIPRRTLQQSHSVKTQK